MLCCALLCASSPPHAADDDGGAPAEGDDGSDFLLTDSGDDTDLRLARLEELAGVCVCVFVCVGGYFDDLSAHDMHTHVHGHVHVHVDVCACVQITCVIGGLVKHRQL